MEPNQNHQDAPRRQSQDSDGLWSPLKDAGEYIAPALSMEGRSPVLAMESGQREKPPSVGQHPISGYPPQWTPADEYRARQASRGPWASPPLRTNLPSNSRMSAPDQMAIQSLEASLEEAHIAQMDPVGRNALRQLDNNDINNFRDDDVVSPPGFLTRRYALQQPDNNSVALQQRDNNSINNFGVNGVASPPMIGDATLYRNLAAMWRNRQHPQLLQGQGTRVVGPPPGFGYDIGRPMAHDPNRPSPVRQPGSPLTHEQAASPNTNALARPPVPPVQAPPRYANAQAVADRVPSGPPAYSSHRGFGNGVSRSSPPRPVKQGQLNGAPLQQPWAGEPNGSPFQQPVVHQLPASRAPPAPAQQDALERRDPPDGPAQAMSRHYKGNSALPANMSANIEQSKNCSLWMTNLPRDCSEGMLLGVVRSCGKVFQTVINPPQPDHNHTGCAAKLIFFHHEDAARLLRRSRQGMFRVGDRQPNVIHNRTRVPSQRAGKDSRVLQITGPREIVNYKHLTELFTSVCKYQLEAFEDRGPVSSGLDSVRYEMIWRFGSYRCQAQWCYRALHDQRRRHRTNGNNGDPASQTDMGRLWKLVEINYGVDPCDVNPGAQSSTTW